MVRRIETTRVPRRVGFTLTEMAVVVAIVAALATLLSPLMPQVQVSKTAPLKSPHQVATEATMTQLRNALAGTPNQPGYWNDILTFSGDTTQTPATLRDLFIFNPALLSQYPQYPGLGTFSPSTRHGWRGPYLNDTGTYTLSPARGFTTTFGQPLDPALLDGWGNPIVIQWPDAAGQFVRLVSAGPNGVLETALTDLTAAARGDDVVLFLRQPLP